MFKLSLLLNHNILFEIFFQNNLISQFIILKLKSTLINIFHLIFKLIYLILFSIKIINLKLSNNYINLINLF